MSDQIQVVSSRGWFARIGDSIKGLLFGGLLFLGSFPLLWWNEGRAVQTFKSLQEGRGSVVSVTAETPDPGNDRRLIHLTGRATTTETLTDPVFRISESAIRLKRKAETFQWIERSKSEKRKKLGGGEETVTTYTYSKDWHEGRVDSSRFKQAAGHENPSPLPVESDTFQAKIVTVGGFQLSDALIGGIRSDSDVTVTEAALQALPAEMKSRARVSGGGLFIGRDAGTPTVGDTRVRFTKTAPADVSVIARQDGRSLGPYQTQAGDKIEILRAGVMDASAIFEGAERANTLMTWALRFVGFLVMMFAVVLLLRPIRVLADVVPFLGTIVGMGLGLVAFAVAAPLSLFTIALAWVAYRPLLGISLLLLACVIAGWFVARVLHRRRAMEVVRVS